MDSELDVEKIACDIQKDQVHELAVKSEEKRLMQQEASPETEEYVKLGQEFQKLTDEALEKRNWYIANCLE